MNQPDIRSFISQGHTRIDVHHHIFPASIGKAGLSAQVGWLTPPENLPWTPDVSLKAMDQFGVRTAVLSLPAGLPAGPAGDENRMAARGFNEYATQICDRHPGRFGFFACLPNLFDTEGACSGALSRNDAHGDYEVGVLSEIEHCLGLFPCWGIAMSSSYGEGADASKSFPMRCSVPLIGLL